MTIAPGQATFNDLREAASSRGRSQCCGQAQPALRCPSLCLLQGLHPGQELCGACSCGTCTACRRLRSWLCP
eukprot:10663-Heterococcus_DN1.PRE.3